MITSTHNPKIQRVRALLGRRKERETEQAFVVEGVRLVEEALSTSGDPQLILYTPQLSDRGMDMIHRMPECDVEEISEQVMESVAGTETPQGILAVMPIPIHTLPQHLDFILIIDNLRDPGNLGAILRTAAAGGVQAVLLTPGTTDPYAPKVVRAGMGAHFRLPVHALEWVAIRRLPFFQNHPPLQLYLAEAQAGPAPWELDLRSPVGFVLGGEAQGATENSRSFVSGAVSIPMPGNFESLNAAVAAGVLVFEVVRQRST